MQAYPQHVTAAPHAIPVAGNLNPHNTSFRQRSPTIARLTYAAHFSRPSHSASASERKLTFRGPSSSLMLVASTASRYMNVHRDDAEIYHKMAVPGQPVKITDSP